MAPQIACKPKLGRAAPAASWLLALYLLTPRPAQAQAAPAGRAQQAFDDARALMDQGKFPEACAKFAESEALQSGGGTVLNLGICRQREGRTATAFKVLAEALTRAKADARADRVATAQKHLDELAPELSKVTIKLSLSAPSVKISLEVDGELIDPSLVGQPFPLDPGQHQIRASQPGHASWTSELTLGPRADLQTVEVPALAETSPSPVPTTPSAWLPSPASPAPLLARPRSPAAQRGADQALGYALLAGGGAALTTGIYFGARAFSLRSRSNQYFNGSGCLRSSCVDDWDSAKVSARVSDVAFGLSALAFGAGAYVLLKPAADSTGQASWLLSVGASQSGARATASREF
jgi:hypothetical protein